MALSAENIALLQQEYESGKRRICLVTLHLLIGNDQPYTYKNCVYGYQPEHLIKMDQVLMDSILKRLSDPVKGIGITPFKHKGKKIIKIHSVTYTYMTDGYKKL